MGWGVDQAIWHWTLSLNTVLPQATRCIFAGDDRKISIGKQPFEPISGSYVIICGAFTFED
jgi:hypothetical protein